MSEYVTRSRVTKALTDAGLTPSFAAAEARLDAVVPCIAVGAGTMESPAGQTAALTAVVTAVKCFGHVVLTGEALEQPLHLPLLVGASLGAAAQGLGAHIETSIPQSTTHLIRLGHSGQWDGWQVAGWWNRWLAGTRRDPEQVGGSSLGLAGMFAGALAVRQVFAHVLGGLPPREETVSLWEPSVPAKPDEIGPIGCTVPGKLWLLGLGHLGQAFVWGLLSLPMYGERYAVLQDDQCIEPENEATSVLVGTRDLGSRKARVAARWLDHAGWKTELIERRHVGDIRRMPHDPQILLAGLDSVKARRTLATHGFDYMIDAGIGRGARGFETLQIRTIPAGSPIDGLWLTEDDARRDQLMAKEAYAALEREIGQCGVIPLADASVSVPFVGAATAALTLSQLARLGAMQTTQALLQLELGAPGLVIDGGMVCAPKSFLGGQTIRLD